MKVKNFLLCAQLMFLSILGTSPMVFAMQINDNEEQGVRFSEKIEEVDKHKTNDLSLQKPSHSQEARYTQEELRNNKRKACRLIGIPLEKKSLDQDTYR